MTNGNIDRNKYPILLVHGLVGSAEDFLRMGPNRSIGENKIKIQSKVVQHYFPITWSSWRLKISFSNYHFSMKNLFSFILKLKKVFRQFSGNFTIFDNQINKFVAFLLANDGYDVWLGNMRGTMYSSHTTLKKNDQKYWLFRWASTIFKQR